MVEKSSDITDIGTGQPKKFDLFDRADMAFRRIPGLGVLALMFVVGYWFRPDDSILRLLFTVLTLALTVGGTIALVEEFWPHVFGGKSLISRVPAKPSRPSA